MNLLVVIAFIVVLIALAGFMAFNAFIVIPDIVKEVIRLLNKDRDTYGN